MRLFFGLSLPQKIRAATHALSLHAQSCISGRYAPPDNHHITLAFLGDVPEERLCDACKVLSRCAAAHSTPVLTLDGLAHFGRPENGILIIRVKSDPPLDTLHTQLVMALRAASLPADPGPFSPHITLARHAVVPPDLPECPPLCFAARNAHVFLSARDGQNVLRYTPIDTFPFASPHEN